MVPLWNSSSLVTVCSEKAVTNVLCGVQIVEDMWSEARVSKTQLSDKSYVESLPQLHLNYFKGDSEPRLRAPKC